MDKIEQPPALRFVSEEQYIELVNLYHLARAAVGSGRYERVKWASDAFHKNHPEISSTAAYKDLSARVNFS